MASDPTPGYDLGPVPPDPTQAPSPPAPWEPFTGPTAGYEPDFAVDAPAGPAPAAVPFSSSVPEPSPAYLDEPVLAADFARPVEPAREWAEPLGRPRRMRSWSLVLVIGLLAAGGVAVGIDAALNGPPEPVTAAVPEVMTSSAFAGKLAASVPVVVCETQTSRWRSSAVVVQHPESHRPVLLTTAHGVLPCTRAGGTVKVGIPAAPAADGVTPQMRLVTVSVLAADEDADVVLLRADLDVPPLVLAGFPEAGDAVAVYGHPGDRFGVLQTGAIDEVRPDDGTGILEIDVDAGDSGAPVVDASGQVVGMVRAALELSGGRTLTEAVTVEELCRGVLDCRIR